MKPNVLADLVFAAGCSDPVLIVHPSSVSRETYARFIHEHSRFRENPFITIFCQDGLCAGPMPALLRSTFGRIQRGTLFLDGIDDLGAPAQRELEVLLAELGPQAPPNRRAPLPPPRLRLIAGIGQPLRSIVAAGRFSASLFSRLAIIHIANDATAGDHIRDLS